MPTDLLEAIIQTAADFRRAYGQPAMPVLIVWPHRPWQRDEFIAAQQKADPSKYVFDWSAWPIEARPGRSLTAGECQQIIERVNARIAVRQAGVPTGLANCSR